MANTRQVLKPYMGYSITKINGYRYYANNGKAKYESNDLKCLKDRIKQHETELSQKEEAI